MSNKQYNPNKYRQFLTAFLILAIFVAPLISTYNALAAGVLFQTSVRFDRLQAGVVTTGTICFKPGSSTTESSLDVTYPTGYTLGTATTFTVTTTNQGWPTGAIALPGVATASGVAGQVVTFPFTSSTLSTSSTYCFNWDNTGGSAVTTNATPGTYQGTVSTKLGGTIVDTEQYSTATITSDTIAVTASVPAAFQFSFTNNTDNFSLGTSLVSVSPSAHAVSVSTNAKNGWTVWAKSLYAGLCSPSVVSPSSCSSVLASIQTTAAATNRTLTAGTTDYVTGLNTPAKTSGATPVIVGAFQGAVATGQGGGLSNTYQAVAGATGPSNNATFNLLNAIAINATVPSAADYTDTITLVGAGLF